MLQICFIPFCDKNSDNNDDDDDDGKYFAVPRVSASICDLFFDPRSSPVSGYFLAVALEDHSEGNGLFVVNVASSEVVMESKYLVETKRFWDTPTSECKS
jgi:hypothetical protein